MTDKHQKILSHFKNYNGKNFDKDYMDHMVKDHDEDVAEFKKAIQNAKNADLKAFAAKTLPVIEEHLKMAKEIQSSMKK
jgi:putative membrane protein